MTIIIIIMDSSTTTHLYYLILFAELKEAFVTLKVAN
jgi:hypothetical protein